MGNYFQFEGSYSLKGLGTTNGVFSEVTRMVKREKERLCEREGERERKRGFVVIFLRK